MHDLCYAESAMGPRYRAFADAVRVDCGQTGALVYVPWSRAALHCSRDDLELLARCGPFATLGEHAARCSERLHRDPAAVEADLARLAAAGLLCAEEQLRAALGAPSDDGRTVVERIGIPSRGRAASLHLAVQSYRDNAREHGRRATITVSLGGGDDEQRASAALVRGLGDAQLELLDNQHKRAFAAALAAEAEVDPALVRWALCGDERGIMSVGAERNSLLLHHVGQPLVLVDDDTLPLLSPAPARSDELALGAAGDVSDWWFGDDVALARPVAQDFLALHEALLGRTVRSLVREWGSERTDLRATGSRLARTALEHDGRVLWTQLGTEGDTGMGTLAQYLLLSGASRARLLASEQRYREALRSRTALRAPRQPTVTVAAQCMAFSLGLDARALMPPSPPCLRNSDGMLAVLLLGMHASACAGHMPWMVRHRPPEPRPYDFDELCAGAVAERGNDLLIHLVAAARIPAMVGDPARSLRNLGDYLLRVASQPPADFEEQLRIVALERCSQRVGLLDRALRQHACEPAFWAQDLRRLRTTLLEHAPKPEHVHARDFVEALGRAEGRAAFREHVRRYGELLCAWPALWAAAGALRQHI